MTDKANDIVWAADAVAAISSAAAQSTHAIADLICDLGHLAEERDLDFLAEVQRGIGHKAEHHSRDRDNLGREAAVEIPIKPR